MFQHHYTTFSHHNSFWPIDTEDNGNPTNKSLNVWTQTPLNVDFVRANRMPITDAYAAAALTEHKTVYHYIRDHLGYRLELHSVDIEVDADLGIDGSDSDGAPAIATDAGGDARQMQAMAASATPTLSVTLRLNNRGFSAPINRRSMEFVLIKVNNGAGGAGGASFTGNPTGTIGDVVWSGRPTNTATGKEADWRDWQPHTPGDPLFVQCNHTIMLSGGVPATVPAGTYHLGLSIREPLELGCSASNAVKFSNDDLEYWLQLQGEDGGARGGEKARRDRDRDRDRDSESERNGGSCYNGTAILGNVIIQ